MAVSNEIAARFGFGTSRTEEEDAWIEEQYARYQAYERSEKQHHQMMVEAGVIPPGSLPSVMSEAQFGRTPPIQQERLIQSIPRALLERDKGPGGREIVPPGYVLEAGANRAYSFETFSASYLGYDPTAKTMTLTAPRDRVAKTLTQRLGEHEQVFHEGKTVYHDELLAGTGAQTRGRHQVFRGALILADPFHGMGLLDPRFGTGYRPQYYEERLGDEAKYVEPGTTFKAGERIALAEGLTGRENRLWNTTVEERVRLEADPARGLQSGYGFILRQRSPDINIKWAEEEKAMMLPMEFQGRAVDTGEPLEFVQSLKTGSGAGVVYSHYRGLLSTQGRQALAEELGMETLPGSFAELSSEAHAAFMKKLPSMVRPIQFQLPIHESMLERYGTALKSYEPIEGKKGYYMGTWQYWGLVGDFARQATIEYDPRRRFLNAEEWRHYERTRPAEAELAAELGGRRRQQAYRNVIRAAGISAGLTSRPTEPQMVRKAEDILPDVGRSIIGAEIDVQQRLGLKPGDELPFREVMGAFYERIRPYETSRFIDWGEGLVSPSFGSIGRMTAPGEFQHEMVGKMATALFNLARKGGNDEMSRLKLYNQLQEFAESPGVWKEAQGMWLPEELMIARKGFTGPWVPYNAVVLPEGADRAAAIAQLREVTKYNTEWEKAAEGGAVVRSPSGGLPDYREQVVTLPAKVVDDLGVPTNRMYIGEGIVQIRRGDVDGDIFQYLLTLQDAMDQGLMSVGHVERLADIAIQRGHAALFQDQQTQELTHEQAVSAFAEKMGQPTPWGFEDVESELNKWRLRKEQIGPYFNIFRKLSASNMGLRQEEAWQNLFELSHGPAQRPAAALPEVQAVRNLATFNLATGGMYDKEALVRGEQGMRGEYLTGASGLQGLTARTMWQLARTESQVPGQEGKRVYRPEDVAALLATSEKQVPTIQKALGLSQADFVTAYGNLVTPGQFATQSAFGSGITAIAAQRTSKKTGLDIRSVLGRAGLSEGAISKVAELAQGQEDIIALASNERLKLGSRLEAGHRRGLGWVGEPTEGGERFIPDVIKAGLQRMRRRAGLVEGEAGWVSPSSFYHGGEYGAFHSNVGYVFSTASEALKKAGMEDIYANVMPGSEVMAGGTRAHEAVTGAIWPEGDVATEEYLPFGARIGGVRITGKLDVPNLPGKDPRFAEIKPIRGLEDFLTGSFTREEFKQYVVSNLSEANKRQIASYYYATGRGASVIPYISSDLPGAIQEDDYSKLGARAAALHKRYGAVDISQEEIASWYTRNELRKIYQERQSAQARQAGRAEEAVMLMASGQDVDLKAFFESGQGPTEVKSAERRKPQDRPGGDGGDDKPPKKPTAAPAPEEPERPGRARDSYRQEIPTEHDVAAMAPLMTRYEEGWLPRRAGIMAGESVEIPIASMSPLQQDQYAAQIQEAQAAGLDTITLEQQGALLPGQRAGFTKGRVLHREMRGAFRMMRGASPELLARTDIPGIHGSVSAFMQRLSGHAVALGADIAQLEPRAELADYERGELEGTLRNLSPIIREETEKLLSGLKWTNKNLQDARENFELMGQPAIRDDFKTMRKSLQEAIKAQEQYQPWAEEVLGSDAGQQVLAEASQIAAGQKEITPSFLRKWEKFQGLNVLTQKPGQMGGFRDVGPISDEISRQVAQADLEGRPIGRGRIGSAAEQLYSELTFGGAYFKLMAANRLFGRPVQQWQEAAQGYAGAQLSFATEMGAGPGAIMATPMGNIAAAQARVSSFQEGMGYAALSSQAGFAGLFAGGQSPYRAGRALGAVATPIMKGTQIGLTAGVIASALGHLAPALGEATTLGQIAGGIGAASGPIGLLVGTGAALAYGGAYAWNEGSVLGLRRQRIEQELAGEAGSLIRGGGRAAIATRAGRRGPGFSFASQIGMAFREILTPGDQYAEEAADWRQFRESPQYQIAKAQVYVEEMNIEGLDQAQKAQIGALIALGGITPQEIMEGKGDAFIRAAAPMAMSGTLEGAIGRAMQFSTAAGIAPGRGFMPYLNYMAELSPTGQQQAVIASQVLGRVSTQLGLSPGAALVTQYQRALQEGVPIYQLESQARASYGVSGIASAMGYTQGSPSALAVTGTTGPLTSAQEAALARQASTQAGALDYAASIAAGSGARFGPEEATAFVQESQRRADLLGWTGAQESRYRQWEQARGLEGLGFQPGSTQAEEFYRKYYPQAGGPGDVITWNQFHGEVGAAISIISATGGTASVDQAMQAVRRYTGQGVSVAQAQQYALGDLTQQLGMGLEGLGLYTGTPEAEAFGEQFVAPGWLRGAVEKRQVGQAITTNVYPGAAGTEWSPNDVMSRVMAKLTLGYAPSIAQRMVGLETGGASAFATTLGFLPGTGNELELTALEQGASLNQIAQGTGQVQFGMSELGYSMMAGRYGVGQSLRQTFGALAARGYGPGVPTGQPLILESGYSFNQLALRQAGYEQMAMSHAYTMGTGAYATATSPAWSATIQTQISGLTPAQQKQYAAQIQAAQEAGESTIGIEQQFGGQTFQMGIAGQIAMAQRGIEVTAALRGNAAAQRAASYEQQFAGLGLAAKGAALSRRQSLESLALQQQMWGANIAFQRQEMGFGYEQMQQQRAWQVEDFAYGRQVAGIQYGWQMEDYDRSIRLATGRQKEQLIRQRARAEEMYTMEEGRRGTEEERAKTLFEQEDERFARQKQHFEEITSLQEEQFSMQRRHIEERYALEMERIGSQSAHLSKMKELEDERRKITEEWEDEQAQYRLAQYENQQKYQEDQYAKQLEIKGLQDEIEDNHAEYMRWQIDQYKEGGKVYTAHDKTFQMIYDWLVKIGIIASAPNPIPTTPPGEEPPGMPTALGGDVSAGVPVVVGELGPEYFTPGASGTITPNSFGVRIGSVSITVQAAENPQETAQAVFDQLEALVDGIASRQRIRGAVWD